ncbi:hypothetical protein [Rhizobium sp. IMFF44]|uniref:hypothetical protein n=1 Tax=Rhizobium sp. IMFF44 TaxID=3342350 RepID=UPI0035BBF71C
MPGFQTLFGRRACRFLSAVLVAAIVCGRFLFFFFQHVCQLVDAFKAGDGGGGLRQETGIRVDSLNSLVGGHGTCNFFNQLSDTHFKLLIVFVSRKLRRSSVANASQRVFGRSLQATFSSPGQGMVFTGSCHLGNQTESGLSPR